MKERQLNQRVLEQQAAQQASQGGASAAAPLSSSTPKVGLPASNAGFTMSLMGHSQSFT